MRRKLARRYLQARGQRQTMRQLRRELPAGTDLGGGLNLRLTEEVAFPRDIRIRRTADGLDIALMKMDGKWPYVFTRNSLPAFVYWFACCGPEVKDAVFDCSDGDWASAARFANSTFRDDVVPLPDAHFFANRGYRQIDEMAPDAAADWFGRSDQIVWRGAPTGRGYFNVDAGLKDHPATVQRVRMAQLTKGTEIDFRFVEMPGHPHWNAAIKAGGMIADRQPQESWAGRKFAIDIDGFSNAWSNLMVRLKLGCCVFKVQSDFGFRQWYYDRLKPFEHYIPVRSDLSDLFEKVDWARSNPGEACEIAKAGQSLARGLTFESETKESVRLITKSWSG